MRKAQDDPDAHCAKQTFSHFLASNLQPACKLFVWSSVCEFIIVILICYWLINSKVDVSITTQVVTGAIVVHHYGSQMFRRGASWKKANIMGAITLFFAVLSTATAVWTSACGPVITDAVHITHERNTQGKGKAECAISGTVVAIAAFVGNTVSAYVTADVVATNLKWP